MPDTRFDARPYLIATGLVALAAVARYVIGLYEERVLFFAVFYPAILVAALWGGASAGLFATVLALVIGVYAFIPPVYTFEFKGRATVVNCLLFLCSSGLIVWVAERYRRAMAAVLESEETRKLLVDEMRHRSGNTLAIARSVIGRTLADDPNRAETLYARMSVLLNSDDLYQDAKPVGEYLHQIVVATLKPHGTERFAIVGDRLRLSPAHSRSLALIFHELVTNAVKYGALSVSNGFITVSWVETGDVLDIYWREKGSLDRTPPAAKTSGGFGTRLIDILAGKLNGTITRQFDDQGLTCQITLPLSTLTQLSADTGSPGHVQNNEPARNGVT